MIATTAVIRQAFPALHRRSGGKAVAYFDGPGGTQVPAAVIAAIGDYLVSHNANTGWVFPSSVETARVAREARIAAADFMGGRPEEIVFGPNMTSLTFQFAAAFGRTLQPGDELIVTRLDHRANVDPWRAVAAEAGAVVKQVPFDPDTGRLDWPRLEASVSKRTRLLAVGAASNSLGTINDVSRAAELRRASGALLFVDAVHSAAHVRTDVAAWDCDAAACSPYKFYGPHAGILWAREELLAMLEPRKLEPAPDSNPVRWEVGTPSYEGLAGTTAAIDWLASLSTEGADRRSRLDLTFAALHERGRELGLRLWAGLLRLPGVTVYGPPPEERRTPTIAFEVQGVAADTVASRLAIEHGVFVSHGHFYAPDVVEDLGVQGGLVRAGCACYTVEEEVDRLLAGVGAILRS